MKALVADDQLHVYKALQLQVHWEAFGITDVFYAQDGTEALKIMEQEMPELVFTDMQMPHMDGPEFLKELRKRGYDCEVIAISGYNDFAYVKSLIATSGVDYLLKPLDEDELNAAVKKAAERIWKKEEKRKNDREILINKTERSCQRIGSWLNGLENFNEEIENHLGYLGIGEGNYRIALLMINNVDRIISDIYDEDASAFHQELLKIARDLFVKSTCCYLLPANRYLYFFLIQTPSADETGYRDRMERMERVIHNLLLADSIYVYSERIAAIKQLPALIENLKSRIQTQHFRYTGGRVVPIESEHEMKKVDYHEGRINGLSFLIRMAVREKDLESVGNIITEFCNGIREKGQYSFYELQIYTTEINLLLKKILAESRELGSFQLKQVSSWIYDLDDWENKVREALMEIASCHFENAVNITSVHAYILENFNQDLSIPDLSERFNQSPQYLSKLYKNKYDETIGQTIKRVRMEKAQEYLRHSRLTIREIAGLVGFEDDNYFGKVFKKFSGISPQQYRKDMLEE